MQAAADCYASLADFRLQRIRCRDYTFGRQWNDRVEIDGKIMSEYDYIVSEGSVPLKNNLISRIVRNVLGVFRKQLDDLVDIDNDLLRQNFEKNRLAELYSRTMEEFLISGLAVHRKWIGLRDGEPGVWTESVSPESFFFNGSARDARGWDVDMIGEIHKVDFRTWCSEFVSNEKEFQEARRQFDVFTKGMKVYEIWRREMRPRRLVHLKHSGKLLKIEENETFISSNGCECRSKWFLDDVWRYYYISENGVVLKEGDSPYLHGSHPFVFRGYPFLDGEIKSFVYDIIDQQRYANRLITLYDWVIRSSAKGVLLMPETAVDTENLQEVADQWSRFNGVIVYRPKTGVPDPRQVCGNTSNIGISELLEIQLKMLEDVSGVNGALQGNLAANSVSGTLYTQQTENSMTSLSDILHTFGSFMQDCKEKDLSLMKQTTVNRRG